MQIILSIFLILLSVFYQVESEKSSEKCPAKLHKQADENMYQQITFGSVERAWPTNQVEFKKFCKDDTKYGDSIKKYSDKCLTGLSKQITNLLMYSIVKGNANICKSKRRADEFIVNSKCANAAKQDHIKCFKEFVLKIKNLQFMTDHKMKMPGGCCVSVQMGECFDKAYEKFPNQCSFKQISGMRRLFETYITDVLKVFCGDYNGESDKCETVAPFLSQNLTKTTDKSMMSGMIEMFETLP